MQKLSAATAFMMSNLVTVGAWAQSTISDASKHPSGGELLQGVQSWASSHPGAAVMLSLTAVFAIGLIIYNRFIAGR